MKELGYSLEKRISILTLEETKNIISHGKLKLDPSQLECEWDGKQLPDKLNYYRIFDSKRIS